MTPSITRSRVVDVDDDDAGPLGVVLRGKLNLARRSITGITLPRRLMTPLTWAGTCGTGVMSITLMISRTLRTGRPYSSLPREKVRYLPASAAALNPPARAALVHIVVAPSYSSPPLELSRRCRCRRRESAARRWAGRRPPAPASAP